MSHLWSVTVASCASLIWPFFRDTVPDGGIVFGSEEQDTSTPEAIVSQCEIFMRKNLLTGTAYGHKYSFNQPSTYKYSPSQWLWDSGAHQIVWIALGFPDLAIADLRSMFHFQQDDGRIPEEINWRYRPRLADSLKPRLYSKNEYNDLTQMPVLPYSLRAIYKATGDVELLKEFVPKIIKYFDWWRTTRALDDTGLVTILHPWESGLDLTPAYDAALGVDSKVRARPPWRAIYPQLLTLGLSYHYRYGWNQSLILSRTHPSPGPLNFFKAQDIAVNSVYASGWFILSDLSSIFSPSLAATCLAHARHASKAIQTVLFDPQLGRYVTGYRDGEDRQVFSRVHTIQSLFPLLLPDLPGEHVRGIVESITDPAAFGSPFPLPSVARSEESYNPIQDSDLLWRGPVWGFPNWFVMEGLELHGETGVRDGLMEKWEAMVRENGVWENYNPETGIGYGAEGLGMSCTVVDWMARLGRI